MEDCLFRQLFELDHLRNKTPAQLREKFELAGIPIPEIPNLNTAGSCLDKFQKELVLEYRLPVISDAVNGKRSVQDAYLELSKINTGISRHLPRKRDEVHNNKVLEMAEIVGFNNVRPFFKTSIVFPDNILTGYAISQTLSLLPPLVLNVKPAYYLLTFAASLGFGLFASRYRKEDYSELDFCSNGESRAIYVDKKIEELF